jgi:NAD(P)-dependent dehydrogenase (short-subunit alcohol dehydrogenase family)
MGALDCKVAWVTGAGSGIGRAGALALARDGATVVLSGRRRDALERTAAMIDAAGGSAVIETADVTRGNDVTRVAGAIESRFGRIDVLVNNAGINILDRSWGKLTASGAEDVLRGNLLSAFQCTSAVLPMMRARKDGVLIHVASFAGRFVSVLAGPAYSAAKHGVVAMSHSINMEEGVNGIRSTVLCPGEVATEILDKRPVPVSAEDRARMVQPEDCGDLIRYVACLPSRVVMNEVLLGPTWNRTYVAALRGPHVKV